MSRKDYEKFARMIRARVDATNDQTPHEVFDRLEYAAKLAADVFVEDNPRFDKQRFLTACGVE